MQTVAECPALLPSLFESASVNTHISLQVLATEHEYSCGWIWICGVL